LERWAQAADVIGPKRTSEIIKTTGACEVDPTAIFCGVLLTFSDAPDTVVLPIPMLDALIVPRPAGPQLRQSKPVVDYVSLHEHRIPLLMPFPRVAKKRDREANDTQSTAKPNR
jgi:hypothetical protein